VTLTVLNVAYPLAPVGPDAIGGAEQVLSRLDHALVEAGHRSLVLACEGSQIAGTLIRVPQATGALDPAAVEAAREAHRIALANLLEREAVDLVHMHGVDFYRYLPPSGVPVLATLHLPLDWYSQEALTPSRPNTWTHCVSRGQHASRPAATTMLPPIENGVPAPQVGPAVRKRKFALMLGRICPEKGVHLAVEAAKRADIPLLIAGVVYPYPDHARYFSEVVAPRLDGQRRFVGPVGGRRKQRLLGTARCLLVPSLAAETSSLVAREALAAGTPVIAFRAGALAETVQHGQTGLLVSSVEEMAAAIRRIDVLDGRECRAYARAHFSLEKMTIAYLDLYARLACGRPNLDHASAA
jgi:Glycosyl transferases group 1/Glycosyltransferase Family 4